MGKYSQDQNQKEYEASPLKRLFLTVGGVFCVGVTAMLLLTVLQGRGASAIDASTARANLGIMDQFDMSIGNAVSDALDGILSLKKMYWLPDEFSAAPNPDPACAGEVTDPHDMKLILEDAQKRLNIEDMVFSVDTPIQEGSRISYYLDDTIFSVTWKQPVDKCIYTMSEVKVGHPSQFRRFLSGGSYGSGVLYTASDMAASVNAVTACSGDYYSYRPGGTTIFDGEVMRVNGNIFDICFVDSEGDLILSKAGELNGQEEVEKFVKDRDIRFSLCFGPILVEDGQPRAAELYPVGEGFKHYSRAAIGQQEPLHYILATANMEPDYPVAPTLVEFGRRLSEMGVRKAYALDGGQTATLIANDQVINTVSYGNERLISDIIYFGTAIPEGQ